MGSSENQVLTLWDYGIYIVNNLHDGFTYYYLITVFIYNSDDQLCAHTFLKFILMWWANRTILIYLPGWSRDVMSAQQF